MTVETDLYSTLAPLVANRVYPDVGPAHAALPYVTYQQVGGNSVNFMEGLASKRNGRFQITVWAATRIEAAALIRQVFDTVKTAAVLQAPVALGEPVAMRDEDTHYAGARQDFSIWFEA